MCVAAWVYMRIRFNVWRILCPLVNLKPLFGVFGKRWGGRGVEEITITSEKKPTRHKGGGDQGGDKYPSKQTSRQAGDSQTGVFRLSSINRPLSLQRPRSLPFPSRVHSSLPTSRVSPIQALCAAFPSAPPLGSARARMMCPCPPGS